MASRKKQHTVRRRKERISTTVKNEIMGIIIIGLACLGFVVLYSDNAGIAAQQMAKILRIAAGDGSAGLFVVLAGAGIWMMGQSKNSLRVRVAGIILLWLVFEGMWHLSYSASSYYHSAEMFQAGKIGRGGGLIGAGISIVLVNALGVTGSYVLLAFLALIGAVLTINRSLIKTLLDLASCFQKAIGAIINQLNDFLNILLHNSKERNFSEKNRSKIFETRKARRSQQTFVYESFPEENYVIVNTVNDELRSSQQTEPVERTEVNPIIAENKKGKEEALEPVSFAKPDGKISSTPLSRKTETEKKENYRLPPLTLVHKSLRVKNQRINKNLADSVRLLEETLNSFGVKVKVTRVTQGPTITRYEVQPAPGVKVSKITSLADDIALSLAAPDVRIEAPIPGKSAVGIEVPNREITIVHFREVLESDEFQNSPSKLSLALGKDITGNPVVADLTRMPHLLIAGATGSGKSVCINTIIASLVFKAKPDEVKLLLIDPKMVELTNYNGIPHLIAPVITEPQKAASALKWIVSEMESRYELFAASGVRDIVRYNYIVTEKKENDSSPLPYVVVIIDELADLMMVAPGEVEEGICRLAQMARAAGIHLIVATQRPSVDVITGLIKANIPSRIAFAVSSQTDSRTILDMSGAEKLLGRGDMLYHPIGISKPVRVQGCFLADKEVKNITDYLRNQAKPEYSEIPESKIELSKNDEPEDELFYKAAKLFIESKTASVSLLQRRLRIGYTRAARLMDILEEKGVVGQYEGSKPREVLLTKSQFEQKYGKLEDI